MEEEISSRAHEFPCHQIATRRWTLTCCACGNSLPQRRQKRAISGFVARQFELAQITPRVADGMGGSLDPRSGEKMAPTPRATVRTSIDTIQTPKISAVTAITPTKTRIVKMPSIGSDHRRDSHQRLAAEDAEPIR